MIAIGILSLLVSVGLGVWQYTENKSAQEKNLNNIKNGRLLEESKLKEQFVPRLQQVAKKELEAKQWQRSLKADLAYEANAYEAVNKPNTYSAMAEDRGRRDMGRPTMSGK